MPAQNVHEILKKEKRKNPYVWNVIDIFAKTRLAPAGLCE